MNKKKFISFCENGNVQQIKKCLEHPRPVPKSIQVRGFCFACRDGHSNVVDYFLDNDHIDPSVKGNQPLKSASYHGHVEIVDRLLKDKRVDPTIYDTGYPIIYSCENNHIDVVKRLLKDSRVDPSIKQNVTLRTASKYGNEEIVKLLLLDDRVDPSDANNSAVQYACDNGHINIMKRIMSDYRFKQTYRIMNRMIESICGQDDIRMYYILTNVFTPDTDLYDGENLWIQHASSFGATKITEVLLADENVDPTVKANMPLKLASKKGHIEIVKLLLKDNRVNPAVADNMPANLALEHNHLEIVDLLKKDWRVQAVSFKNDQPFHTDEIIQLIYLQKPELLI